MGGNGVRQFSITRSLMGADITAQVLVLDEGCHVSLFGGDLPHIGAVSIANPEGHVTTTQFPYHKEAVLSHKWAGALSEAGYRPCVVEAGIHYDNLNRQEIDMVVSLTGEMLNTILDVLSAPCAEAQPGEAPESGFHFHQIQCVGRGDHHTPSSHGPGHPGTQPSQRGGQ